MERDDLRLYVDTEYASPYALSAFAALQEKDLEFDITAVNLARGENHAPVFAGQSLTRRIPTLQHGSFFISESSAITEYLDEVFPGRALYPTEPQARARARQVQAWLRSDLVPLRQERSTEVVFFGPGGHRCQRWPGRRHTSCLPWPKPCSQRIRKTLVAIGPSRTWIWR